VQEFIRYVILGIPVGCVFALVAVGLVLTFKTSGVFNLAFAAQAYLAAAVYYDVHVRHEWPIVPAFLLAVFVVSPLLGLVLDRFVFRWLRGCSPIGKLVSSLGLLVALPQIVKVWLGPSQSFGIKGIWWDDNALYHFGDYELEGRQLAILVSTAVVVLLLVALFRWTAIGLQMRAVVESPRLTELAGVNADRASATAWMLSSTMAGLAGVLLAPFSSILNPDDFTTLLVAAIAAAAFARLTSIPMAVLGGLLLGVARSLLSGYLPPASLLAQGIKPALPFAALFLLLLFWPGLRNRKEVTDPLSGADPPPPSLAAATRSAGFTRSTHVLGVLFVLVVCYLALFRADDFWLSMLTQVLVMSVIFLSITVITGMAGQISLCQATFAGIGAATTAQFVSALGSNVLLGMVAGAVVAAAIGALLAIPVLRLAGIYLSLATLAFALLFDYVLVPVGWIGGGNTPIRIPRPVIGPFDLSNNKSFFVFCLILLALVSVLVIFVRRGTTGHYLDALRGSDTAAQSIGISPAKMKIMAFALSAGIAGLGGGLFAMKTGISNPKVDFAYVFGLVFVVIVVSTAARTVEGAINAGIGFVLLPYILSEWLGLSASWAFILFGFGAIQYARHPEGTLENGKRTSTAFFQRQLDRWKARHASSSEGGSGDGASPTKTPPIAVESGT
jgi:branched-subunit amino acid ABC-type transport system permease component